MAQREQIYRLMLLAELLKRKQKGVSYDEAYDYLDRKFRDKGFDLKFSEKTFKRDREQIADILGIESSYSRTEKNFKITEMEIEEGTETVFDNILLIDAYRQTKGNSDIMLFEKRKARGLEHLNGILHAIQNKKIITFNYTKYWDEIPQKRVLEPYALKEFNYRWYLLANEKNKDDFKLKTFGLDRVSSLEITHSTFTKKTIDVDLLFKYSFGIISCLDEDPIEIVLSFDAVQGKYIKSLPLHHTQEIMSENAENLVIKLFLVPSFDFIQQILSHGDFVEVISPKNFKNQVVDKIDNMKKRYKKQKPMM